MKSSKAKIRARYHRIPNLAFSRDTRLTSYAGLVVFQALFAALRLRERLRDAMGEAKSRCFGLWRVYLLVVVHLLLGFRRIRHLGYYREDPLVARIVGVRQLPDESTISRTFSTAPPESIDGTRRLTRQMVIEALQREQFGRITIDYDGVVQSTKAHAEGTAVGFNKKKKGARSYYNLFATVAQTGQFFDVLFRPGNVHDSNGVHSFVARHIGLMRIVQPQAILESRFDAAFFNDNLVQLLDDNGVEFSISVPFHRFSELKTFVNERQRWQRIDRKWSYFEKQWKPKSWSSTYRFLFVRQRTHKQNKEPLQLDLFEPKDHTYQYSVIVTNKPARVSAANAIAFHHGRGAQEKIFGEGSQHAALNVVAGKRRATNQLFTLAGMTAHNLGRELQMRRRRPTRREPTNRTPRWKFQTLATLRQTLIHRAARLTRPQRRLTLTLNENSTVRREMKGYLDALSG